LGGRFGLNDDSSVGGEHIAIVNNKKAIDILSKYTIKDQYSIIKKKIFRIY